jgi:hypothetical protein
LTHTSARVSADSGGAAKIGVRKTWPAIVHRAAWISASVTMTSVFPDFRHRYNVKFYISAFEIHLPMGAILRLVFNLSTFSGKVLWRPGALGRQAAKRV